MLAGMIKKNNKSNDVCKKTEEIILLAEIQLDGTSAAGYID